MWNKDRRFESIERPFKSSMTRPSLPHLDTTSHNELFTPMNTPVEGDAPPLADQQARPQRGSPAKAHGRGSVLSRLVADHGITKQRKPPKTALKRGLEAEIHGREVVLRQAADNGDFDAVADLVSRPNIDVSAADSKQRTALHLASVRGHAAVVQLLLLHGAQKDARDVNGNTPLHLAVIGAQIPTCLILLQHGVDPFAHDNGGKTPLGHAETRLRMLSTRAARLGALGGDVETIKKNMVAEVQQVLAMLKVFAANRGSGLSDQDMDWVSRKLEQFHRSEDNSNEMDNDATKVETGDDLQGVIADIQAILDGMKL